MSAAPPTTLSPLPPLADAHSHLQSPRLRPLLPSLLQRAADAGLSSIHVDATSAADWSDVLALRSLPSPVPLTLALGIHPLWTDRASPADLPLLRYSLRDDPSLGVGEIGLDLSPSAPPLDRQLLFYRPQLDLSFELARPVVIHGRGAWSRLLPDLLARPPHPAGILLHSYSGPLHLLPTLHARGIRISLGGALANPRNQRAPRIAAAALPGQLLLETDAPDQPPPSAPFSEPAHIPLYRQILAKILSSPPSSPPP